jgi:hypothetical protein
MAQQTAVEWFFETLLKSEPHILEWQKIFEQAKEMEKEQIIMAHGTKSNGRLKNDGQIIISEINGEQYYNETYNK